MNEEYPVDKDAEKIFELQRENASLRGQITYLQEQLYSAEDEIAKITERYENEIADLEGQLGDALFGEGR
jgi:predicted  nucleic acid-binding Zn-ribbon protein